MDKVTYLKAKIKNFITFIEEKIGKDNIIYSDFTNYHNNIKLFLNNDF